MATEIRVPTLGESVAEATVGQWFKKPGDIVAVDETLCELETDKVSVEVPAPVSGAMGTISVDEGGTVEVGAVLGFVNEGGEATSTIATPQEAVVTAPAQQAVKAGAPSMPPSPAASKILAERGVDSSKIVGSGVRGQVLKEDALSASVSGSLITSSSFAPLAEPSKQTRAPASSNDAVREERVRMTRLRQTIARRLKDAQNTAAMLTTFNDVDMSAVMQIRSDYKELFERRHGVKLGFMGFFVKACIQALKEIPAVNAEIDGQDIIYKNYYHIGVAVGTEKGLVVPVVREADCMSLSELEKAIGSFGQRARDGKLGIEEMQGGTFTITNGGVFGSMMSTPILNAPQSGILGMHRIEKRPIVLKDGSISARPMMYLALSYDHRIVDGKEAVTFLVRVKDYLEDPQRFLLEL
ncbi:MAG: Dihydrolipoyllysine-residue succinyltransferase component of 2-oxoglutarate dehydrogenase complex [Hyphomicrobiaceae bacterium hypho_1]